MELLQNEFVWSRFLHLLGAVLWRQKELPAAEASLRRALKLNPGDPASTFYLARVLADRGRHLDAIPLLQQLLEAEPHDAESHNLLGWSMLETGRTQDAIRHFEAALRTDPQHQEAQANLQFAKEIQ